MTVSDDIDPGYSLEQRFVDRGVWVDPILPKGFMDRALPDRSRLEMGVWWNQPFIQSVSDEDGANTYMLFMLDSQSMEVRGFGLYEVYEEAIDAGFNLLSPGVH